MESIGVGGSFWLRRRVEDCRVGSDLDRAGVLLPEVIGPLSIGELDQVLENVVGTGVAGLIPLPEARVFVRGILTLEASVGVVVVLGGAVLVVDLVALEPLFEAHGTHDVVIGH